jgi:hypothetical protein
MALNNLYQNQQPQGGIDQLAQNAMFPQSQMDKTQYAVPSQMPTSAEVINSDYDPQTDPYTGMPAKPFAAGGIATLRFDGENGSQVQDPSSQVLKGATLVKEGITSDNDGNVQPAIYQLPNGSQISVDPSSGTIMSATPPTSSYTDPANQRPGYRNIPYAFSSMRGQDTININGVDVPLVAPELVIDPNTHQPVTQNGNFVTIQSVSPQPTNAGNLQDIMGTVTPILAASGWGYGAAQGLGLVGEGSVGMVDSAGNIIGGGAEGAAYGTGATGATVSPEFAPVDTPLEGTGAAPGSSAIPDWATQNADAAAQEAAQTAPYNTAPADIASKAGLSSAAAKKALAAYALGQTGLKMLSPQASAAPSSSYSGAMSGSSNTPATNMGGVTGYTGEVPMGGYNASPLQLSRIKGSTGDLSYSAGGKTGGGIATLGSYSDGGQLLKGPGDGMSDNIPAKIGNSQPARLADGEFVIPADVVSHLGNGSTDAGAKQLYVMMEKIRKARTGNKKQGKRINPSKFLL